MAQLLEASITVPFRCYTAASLDCQPPVTATASHTARVNVQSRHCTRWREYKQWLVL